MKNVFLHIYDQFRLRPAAGWTAVAIVSLLLLLSLSRLRFSEDISDFLPLDDDNRTALSVYQEISGADRIYALISLSDKSLPPDPDLLTDGVDLFVDRLSVADSLSMVSTVISEIDPDMISRMMSSVYDAAPIYMTEADFARADTLLSRQGYIHERLDDLRTMLMLPGSSLSSVAVSRDPLGLFSPAVARLQGGESPAGYTTYDGYILSPDSLSAIVVLGSSFGSSESEHNALLVDLLEETASSVSEELPQVTVRFAGGPIVAVTNARQIKSDSLVAILVAALLIIALLIYVYRRARNILLIFASVGWGWLFAMGTIGLFRDSVSIIVIGIGSVIVGIAVNYPLHLIDHLRSSSRPREALAEIIPPLLTGNITTVGAFLCLVPLDSPALRDLGIFSSLLLAGTILFVLLVLPHAVRRVPLSGTPRATFIDRLASLRLFDSRKAGWGVLALAALFGIFSLRTGFDTDLRNISYMTPEQNADLESMGQMLRSDTLSRIYVASSGVSWDDALKRNETVGPLVDTLVGDGTLRPVCDYTDLLPSASTADARRDRWMALADRHRSLFADTLPAEAAATGFGSDAFAPFISLCTGSSSAMRSAPDSGPLAPLFASSVCSDRLAGRYTVVRTFAVAPDSVGDVINKLSSDPRFDGLCFDIAGVNSSLTNTISDSFNYIGIACSMIVLVFLWISFRSLRLALVAFLPMAVSWLWILGIMAILGLQFNIVNIILATFIFGQGDDYTIFVTEGLVAESRGRKLLASFRSSIIFSAIIMFIGIGVLAFAVHPALCSLGQVTLAGMLSVVLVAFLLPPLLFDLLVNKKHI